MIETIGEALDASWKLRVVRAWGKRDAMKSVRECVEIYDVDLRTLVWTRGRNFPVARLDSRMKCPRVRIAKGARAVLSAVRADAD